MFLYIKCMPRQSDCNGLGLRTGFSKTNEIYIYQKFFSYQKFYNIFSIHHPPAIVSSVIAMQKTNNISIAITKTLAQTYGIARALGYGAESR